MHGAVDAIQVLAKLQEVSMCRNGEIETVPLTVQYAGRGPSPQTMKVHAAVWHAMRIAGCKQMPASVKECDVSLRSLGLRTDKTLWIECGTALQTFRHKSGLASERLLSLIEQRIADDTAESKIQYGCPNDQEQQGRKEQLSKDPSGQ